jgi:hypothetical protein
MGQTGAAALNSLLPIAHCLMPTWPASARGVVLMAKGQMRPNKEKRKPKQNKDKKGAKK